MHPLLQRADRLLRDSASALSPDDVARKPNGRWSAAEIIEHLGLTYAATARGLARVAEHGPQPATRRSPMQAIGKLLVVHLGYFPEGRRSPDAVKPRGADPGGVLHTTLAHLAAMDSALDAAELRFGLRVRLLHHPVLGPLNVPEWRRFHWVHTRHHARQIRQRAVQTPG